MNEKDLVILEQYDLHVQSTRRGRGSFLCDTDRGLVQVTEFSGSQERLFFQNRVLFFLTFFSSAGSASSVCAAAI